jgi:hypothetical protein
MFGGSTFMGSNKEAKHWEIPIGPKFQLHKAIKTFNLTALMPPSELTCSSFMSEATARQSFTMQETQLEELDLPDLEVKSPRTI